MFRYAGATMVDFMVPSQPRETAAVVAVGLARGSYIAILLGAWSFGAWSMEVYWYLGELWAYRHRGI